MILVFCAIYMIACGMYIIHDLSKLVDDVVFSRGMKCPAMDSVDQDHRSDRDLITVRIGSDCLSSIMALDLTCMHLHYRTNLSVN